MVLPHRGGEDIQTGTPLPPTTPTNPPPPPPNPHLLTAKHELTCPSIAQTTWGKLEDQTKAEVAIYMHDTVGWDLPHTQNMAEQFLVSQITAA